MPSSDAIDWPTTLPLPLRNPRRVISARNEVQVTEKKWARIRRAYSDYQILVDLVWVFTEDEFEAFKTFFETDLVNGQYSFVITITDPNDSSQEIVTEYGFYNGTYQVARSDNQYNVQAQMIIEEELIEVIPEPFAPGLCGVIIWPDASDGEGGGTTFECYTTGGDYSENIMEPAGTGILIVYSQNSQTACYGETFLTFTTGELVMGSPSLSSHLVLMYYGDAEV